MHELSLAVAVVDQVTAVAEQEGAKAVTAITLVIGRFSGVERSALEFCLPVVARNTIAENAQLLIEEEEPSYKCQSCGAEREGTAGDAICSHCERSDFVMVRGRELRIKSIEIA